MAYFATPLVTGSLYRFAVGFPCPPFPLLCIYRPKDIYRELQDIQEEFVTS
jgi:hypothetical protein